jgi:hypothetical protein
MSLPEYLEMVRCRELNRLRMLADWQIRQLGLDPAEVTAAMLEINP